jgi:enamine deaminase RidA (YjgF/YER057c/UK114 family)
VLGKIDALLKARGMAMADVVQTHVFLVGDPKLNGQLDFQGMMSAYLRYFGTPAQPNRPTRSTVQVAALANPGFLVEIEVIAAKAPRP